MSKKFSIKIIDKRPQMNEVKVAAAKKFNNTPIDSEIFHIFHVDEVSSQLEAIESIQSESWWSESFMKIVEVEEIDG